MVNELLDVVDDGLDVLAHAREHVREGDAEVAHVLVELVLVVARLGGAGQTGDVSVMRQ